MKNAQAKASFTGWPRKTRALFARLKHLRLSPLSAIGLAVQSAMALGASLFALSAFLWPAGWDSDATAPEWTPPTLAVVELEPPKPASADVEALSRPIFAKDRKPSAKGAARANLEISGAPGGLSVTAIVKGGKKASAFLTSSGTPEGAWRKVGEAFDSWTVTAITATEVVLQSGDQSTKAQLYAAPPEPLPDAPPN